MSYDKTRDQSQKNQTTGNKIPQGQNKPGQQHPKDKDNQRKF